MKYIVYLTINKKSKINEINRIYCGVHQTNDPEVFDGYIGCGVYINQPSTYMYPKTPFQYAVKKYGVDSFTRETLYIFDTAEEAYKKEAEIVDQNFIKQDHVYNACLGGLSGTHYKKLYQFDLKGNLIKVWELSKEAYEFYNIPKEKFEYAIHDKHPLLDSLWSSKPEIDITKYSTKAWGSPEVTYLYTKNGKLIKEFESRLECAKFLDKSPTYISNAISRQCLVNKQYYISKVLVDEFKPKAKTQYIKMKFYVYDDKNKFYGEFIGKKVMSIIQLYSWGKIRDIMVDNKGWYKNFYLSKSVIDTVPFRVKNNTIRVDVYDKYGNFIETINTIKEVKEKYNVPASKIKNIEQGNRYFKDWIFKYHSK